MSLVYLCISESGGSTDERIAQAVRKVFSTEPPRIARTELGKPYFPDRPDLHTSVSHSGKYFVCALSCSPVGIDIQEHTLRKGETPENAAVRLQKIAARFFHPAEKEYIEKDTFTRFYRVWTAKEAYVKYTGRGIDGDFSKLCAITDNMPQLEIGKPAVWQTNDAFFSQLRLEDNYTLCLCAGEDLEL